MEYLSQLAKYCDQMKRIAVREDINSLNLAVLRKKLQKCVIKISKMDEDHSAEIEKFWRNAYYLPINLMLRNNDEIDTVTVLTIYSGELYELLLSISKYQSLIYLYLGDLHRYMPSDSIQRSLSQSFYEKCLSIDSHNGRAYNMIGMLMSERNDYQSDILSLRLYLKSMAADKSFNSEKGINEQFNCLDKYKGTDFEPVVKFLKFFIDWLLFSNAKSPTIGSDILKEFRIVFMPYETSELLKFEIPLILSTCVIACYLSYEKNSSAVFISSFDTLCEMFIVIMNIQKNQIISNLLTIGMCEMLIYATHRIKSFQISLPIMCQQTFEKFCDILVASLNELAPQLNESSSKNMDYNITGPITDQKDVINIIGYLSDNLSEMSGSQILKTINENGMCYFERAMISSPRKKLLKPETEEEQLQFDLSEDWKPIYVLLDYDVIKNNFKLVLKLWNTQDFIFVVSSSTLAELDLAKSSADYSTIRRSIREIHERQSTGQVRIVAADDERQCCQRLVDSSSVNAIEYNNVLVARVVCEESQVTNFDISGVEAYTIKAFVDRCSQKPG